MNNNYIEFKKKRELGEILSDTFGFIRMNFKSLFLTILKNTAPAIILLVIALAFMTYVYSDFIGAFSLGVQSGDDLGALNVSLMMISVVILLIAGVLFYGTIFGTILHFIKSYVQNQGEVNPDEISAGVKKDFWKIIGLSILSGLISGFAFMLCVLPAVYVYVPLSLVFAILVFRNTGTFDTIGESFELVKNEWWITFATLLVIFIIGMIISAIFSLPAMFYGIFKGIVVASEGTFTDPSLMTDWISIVLSVIGDLIRYFIMYLLTAISSAFIYFNLNERKHHTGTLERIDSIGKTE